MSKICTVLLLAVALLDDAVVRADDPSVKQRLTQLNEKIKQNPNEPSNYAKKAHLLMELGRYDDGYKTAKSLMKLLTRKKQPLPRLVLETIRLEKANVEVQFNMGAKQRRPPEIGIVKPLTFQIWSGGEDRQLIDAFDFEIGYIGGKPLTGALGQQQDRAHLNFGPVKPDASYQEIRKKAISLAKKIAPQQAAEGMMFQPHLAFRSDGAFIVT